MMVARVGARLVALPIEQVVETTCPLPLAALVGAPPFVLGLSILRGEAVPVIGGAELLEGSRSQAITRFISLRLGLRSAALAVDEVVGIRPFASADTRALPPLLGATPANLVKALGVLDGELLLVLQAARLVPEPVWQQLARGRN
jgi:purine-binding chemotaxis protein CheW